MTNWKTTIFGAILAISMGLSQYGVKIGHVGTGDYGGLAGVLAAIGLGATSKDASNKQQ